MIDPIILRALQAAGATTDMIIAAVEADAAQDAERREKKRANNRERQARYRERHADNADNALPDVTERDERDTAPLPKTPQTPQTPTPPGDIKSPRARKAGFVLPDHIPAEHWAGFEEMRRRIGKPMTDRARSLAVTELDRLAEAGWPPGDVLNHCTMNSYQGIFPPKGQTRNGQHRQSDHQWGSTVSAAQSLIAELDRGNGGSAADRPTGSGH